MICGKARCKAGRAKVVSKNRSILKIHSRFSFYDYIIWNHKTTRLSVSRFKVITMSKSVKRVEKALVDAGAETEIKRMPESTRTAEEAAQACGCAVGQIVKSLIFIGKDSGEIKLLLVSGDHQVDMAAVKATIGEELKRVDARAVRNATGFAIGGVSPIGHITPLVTYMDEYLLGFDVVWAAAGAPNAVFDINPKVLLDITCATKLNVKGE